MEAANDGLQLRRAISIQAEGTGLFEKHAIAPSAARLCWDAALRTSADVPPDRLPESVCNRWKRFREHPTKNNANSEANDSIGNQTGQQETRIASIAAECSQLEREAK